MAARLRRAAAAQKQAKRRATQPTRKVTSKAKPKGTPRLKSKAKPKSITKSKSKAKPKSITKSKSKAKPRAKAKTKGKPVRRHRKVLLADYTAAEEQPLLWDPRTWEHAEQVLGRKRIRLVLEPASEPIETGLAERPVDAPTQPKRAAKRSGQPSTRARVSTKKKPKRR